MKLNIKLWLLGFLTLAAIIIVFTLHPIAQNVAFHNFADHRSFWGIPNFGNVISNIPFLIIGTLGLTLLKKATRSKEMIPIYGVLFAGIILTGLGSAYQAVGEI